MGSYCNTMALFHCKPLHTSIKQPLPRFIFRTNNRCDSLKPCNGPFLKQGLSVTSSSENNGGCLYKFGNRRPEFIVRSAAVPEGMSETTKSKRRIRILQLGTMFAIWYMLNIYFNIFNKQVLIVFYLPVFTSSCFILHL